MCSSVCSFRRSSSIFSSSSSVSSGNPAERSGKLYLRFDNENDPRFQRIKNLLILFPGNQQAVLYLSDTGRRLGARCQLHPALLEELRELLGEENVVLKQ